MHMNDMPCIELLQQAGDDLGACPSAGCPFMFAWEPDNRRLECPLCEKTFCLVCRTEPWHRGQRCEQFQVSSRCSAPRNERKSDHTFDHLCVHAGGARRRRR